jgi:hypothetical protein
MSELDSALSTGLTRAMDHIVKKMKEKINQNNLPKVISDAIAQEPAQISGNQASIDGTIDLQKAPMAAAFEWGSGLHSTKGPQELYPIQAKNAPNLVFWWTRRSKWFVGKQLPYGHPGVAPRPYIEPTLISEIGEVKKIIGKEVKASIIIGVKEMFKS